MNRLSTWPPRVDGLRAGLSERPSRAGERGTQRPYKTSDFGEVDLGIRPCRHCGMVHEYDCQKYVLINIVAALWIAASSLILIAVLPGVVR